LAFSKNHKEKLLSQYEEWIKDSQAVFMMEFTNMSVKDIEDLRAKVRETGGKAHVVKNTLMKIAMERAEIEYDSELVKTTLAGFAFSEVPSLAKVFSDAAKDAERFNLKDGLYNGSVISIDHVKALADLPPLPVLRSQLLGVLQAPASKLVRTFAEPGRQTAAVIKAYSEKDATTA
jgi:large subunit ribosomal protein L10